MITELIKTYPDLNFIISSETIVVVFFVIGYFIKSRFELIKNRKIHFIKMCNLRFFGNNPGRTLDDLKLIKLSINTIPELFNINNKYLQKSLHSFSDATKTLHDNKIPETYDNLLVSLRHQCRFIPIPSFLNDYYTYELDEFITYCPSFVVENEIYSQKFMEYSCKSFEMHTLNNTQRETIYNLIRIPKDIDKVKEFLESIK